ncbi:MAG: bifunctional folylpolyglutamate synthase/dihydrofolate synthase [Verrucomicrobiaceae bacterium]|nr:MAG: bifunctional folylpolyglutamate synthase/dihydrofolate synthase [Verrucomicrobiaceae bacterium]
MDYTESIRWLYSRQESGIKLGLTSIMRLLNELKVPDPEMPIIHVAGTNGKGSTCAFMDSVLRASGYRAGLFTSPHLISFRERISLDGRPANEIEIAEGLTHLKKLVSEWREVPTFFEITTALAFKLFTEKKMDVAVVEVGLGGRLDSTNAIIPSVCVITPISLDHQHILGESISEIAKEKAGIMKEGVPVISAPQHNDAQAILDSRAKELGISVHYIGGSCDQDNISLRGKHQRQNAALAVAALENCPLQINRDSYAKGLAQTKWRGRFEQFPQKKGMDIVIDGAHNIEGARALVETWEEVYGDSKPVVIFAVAANKDLPSLINIISQIAENFILTQPNTPRKLASPKDVAKLIPSHISNEYEESVQDAIKKAESSNRHVLIVGSLFLAGEALSILDEGNLAFEPSEQ